MAAEDCKKLPGASTDPRIWAGGQLDDADTGRAQLSSLERDSLLITYPTYIPEEARPT